ncbi:hypothetical protein L6164_006291 [Bauhinia variegata]|uniref:Uncharacterized protein n=1 Tax=Bauhinia variegata TaxID=167791 RepID=A0ACB9PTY8_BAUVA|nr:hypothetical protein L6164_006291 [Bauhinia variegata]
MKTTLLALALVFLSTLTAADEPEAVLDTSGNRLDNNRRYYILSATDCSCNETGIALAVLGNKKCPFDVYVQCEAQKFYIMPSNYFQTNDVQVSTFVNIVHSATRCEPVHWVNLWKVDQNDPDTGKAFVTTEGTVDKPLPRGNQGFKIEKYGSNYKIVYSDTQCRDIGIYFDKEGNRRLVLGDVPYPVKFQKV